MGRVEKFKEVRRFRIKCVLLLMVCLMFIITGICISDYSINTLMKNQKKILLVEVKNIDDRNVYVSFLNLGMNLDTSYVAKDLEKIGKLFEKMFGN